MLKVHNNLTSQDEIKNDTPHSDAMVEIKYYKVHNNLPSQDETEKHMSKLDTMAKIEYSEIENYKNIAKQIYGADQLVERHHLDYLKTAFSLFSLSIIHDDPHSFSDADKTAMAGFVLKQNKLLIKKMEQDAISISNAFNFKSDLDGFAHMIKTSRNGQNYFDAAEKEAPPAVAHPAPENEDNNPSSKKKPNLFQKLLRQFKLAPLLVIPLIGGFKSEAKPVHITAKVKQIQTVQKQVSAIKLPLFKNNERSA